MELLRIFFSLTFTIATIVTVVLGRRAYRANKRYQPHEHLFRPILISSIAILLSLISIVAIPGPENTASEQTLPTQTEEAVTVEATTTKITTTESSSEPEVTIQTEQPQTETSQATEVTEVTEPTSTNTTTSGVLTVHYIDVGQGDAILFQQGESSMLIDAGGNNNGPQVVSFLNDQGISNLDFVIGTHPHEDHIGGLDDVINAFSVGKVILPDIIHTTRTFEDVLIAIQKNGLKITKAVAGDRYALGQATIEIIGPISINNDDLNNASVVCRVDFGTTSFMFTGDAEETSEQQIIKAGYKLGADVLKVGHHGSNTSTSDAFLGRVAPSHAVIMVGAGNTYNHPTKTTLDRIAGAGINIYRTDLLGTIEVTSDGSNISVNKSPDPGTAPIQTEETKSPEKQTEATTIAETTTAAPIESTAPPAESGQYIGNLNTKKFHYPSCNSLPNPENQIILNSRQEAVDQGYDPCGRCKP